MPQPFELAGDDPHRGDPVADVPRAPLAGDPPVPGAQWDELHNRWEHWDEESGTWVVVGDPGSGRAPGDENPLPSLLAREVTLGDEVEAAEVHIPDVGRLPTPSGPAPLGATWNEVVGRWERWDDTTEAWVEAVDEPESDG